MKTTKVSMMVAVALGSMLVCTNLASAQSTNASKEARRPERRAFSAQTRVEAMSKQLNLTDEQKSKLTALYDEEFKQMQSIRAESSADPSKRQEKLRALRQENEKKLKAILTPEQWTKWEEVRNQFRGRRQNGQGAANKAKPEKEATKQSQ